MKVILHNISEQTFYHWKKKYGEWNWPIPDD